MVYVNDDRAGYHQHPESKNEAKNLPHMIELMREKVYQCNKCEEQVVVS